MTAKQTRLATYALVVLAIVVVAVLLVRRMLGENYTDHDRPDPYGDSGKYPSGPATCNGNWGLRGPSDGKGQTRFTLAKDTDGRCIGISMCAGRNGGMVAQYDNKGQRWYQCIKSFTGPIGLGALKCRNMSNMDPMGPPDWKGGPQYIYDTKQKKCVWRPNTGW